MVVVFGITIIIITIIISSKGGSNSKSSLRASMSLGLVLSTSSLLQQGQPCPARQCSPTPSNVLGGQEVNGMNTRMLQRVCHSRHSLAPNRISGVRGNRWEIRCSSQGGNVTGLLLPESKLVQ